jgi:hypothetical protein
MTDTLLATSRETSESESLAGGDTPGRRLPLRPLPLPTGQPLHILSTEWQPLLTAPLHSIYTPSLPHSSLALNRNQSQLLCTLPTGQTAVAASRSSTSRFTHPPDRPGAPQPAALHALCGTLPTGHALLNPPLYTPSRPARRSSTATVIGTLPQRCTRAYLQASPFLDSLRRRMCTRVLAHAASNSSLRMPPQPRPCAALRMSPHVRRRMHTFVRRLLCTRMRRRLGLWSRGSRGHSRLKPAAVAEAQSRQTMP